MTTANHRRDKVPPHSIEAEQAVLGAILLEPKAMLAARPLLQPHFFFKSDHAKFYQAMLRLHDSRTGIDTVTIKRALLELGAEDVANNPDLFTTLGGQVPSIANCQHYAAIVRDLAVRRETIITCSELLINAYADETDTTELLAGAQSRLIKLSRGANSKDPVAMSHLMNRIMDQVVNPETVPPALSTGFEGLDNMCSGGLRPGLIIVGGRPSSGKSALAQNLVRNWAKAGVRVLMFSLEVEDAQVARNVLCSTSAVSTQPMLDGKLTKEQTQSVRAAMTELCVDHVMVDDGWNLTPQKLRAVLQWQSLKQKVDVVIVDYLQLMHGDGRYRAGERVAEISEISRELKIISREENICVVALSQLNRQQDKDKERPPRLSDLRDSGSIEQDADMVILLHPKKDEVETDSACVPTNLIFAKQRNGPNCTVKMKFHKKTLRFLRWNDWASADERADMTQVSGSAAEGDDEC